MHYNEVTKQSCHTKTPEMYPIGIQIVQSKKGGNLVMFSKKISRRSFLKVSAVTTAMAAMGLPAFAAEDTAEENCFQTLNIPRAAPWTKASC